MARNQYPAYDIAGIRKALSLTQKELAEKLGIRQSFLSTVESGKNRLVADKLDRLKELCRDLDIEKFRVDNSMNSTGNNVAAGGIERPEGNMITELLNYFHSQAHKQQNDEHDQLHSQMHVYQDRLDRVIEKNEALQEKIELLTTRIESLREEIFNVKEENLRLKELLLKYNIPY